MKYKVDEKIMFWDLEYRLFKSTGGFYWWNSLETCNSEIFRRFAINSTSFSEQVLGYSRRGQFPSMNSLEDVAKLTDALLLKIAELKYPAGTEFKRITTGDKHVVTGIPYWSGEAIYNGNGDGFIYHKGKNKWAEIIPAKSVLPEKWGFKVTKENYEEFKHLRPLTGLGVYITSDPYSLASKLGWGYVVHALSPEYTEVSFELFREHILRKEVSPKVPNIDKAESISLLKGEIYHQTYAGACYIFKHHTEKAISVKSESFYSAWDPNSYRGLIRKATPEEKQWLEVCIVEGKFVSKEYAVRTYRALTEEKFKVGDWVYAVKGDPTEGLDCRDAKRIPIFKVEEILEQCGGCSIVLRPKKGQGTGVDSRHCRLATTSELLTEGPFSSPEKVSDAPAALVQSLEPDGFVLFQERLVQSLQRRQRNDYFKSFEGRDPYKGFSPVQKAMGMHQRLGILPHEQDYPIILTFPRDILDETEREVVTIQSAPKQINLT